MGQGEDRYVVEGGDAETYLELLGDQVGLMRMMEGGDWEAEL